MKMMAHEWLLHLFQQQYFTLTATKQNPTFMNTHIFANDFVIVISNIVDIYV